MMGFRGPLQHYLIHITSAQWTLVVVVISKYWFLRQSTLSLDNLDSFILFLWDGWSLSSSSPACDPMIRYLPLWDISSWDVLGDLWQNASFLPSFVFLSAPVSVATDFPIFSCQEGESIFPLFESGLAFILNFLCFYYFLGILPSLPEQAQETLLDSSRHRSLLPLLFHW